MHDGGDQPCGDGETTPEQAGCDQLGSDRLQHDWATEVLETFYASMGDDTYVLDRVFVAMGVHERRISTRAIAARMASRFRAVSPDASFSTSRQIEESVLYKPKRFAASRHKAMAALSDSLRVA